MDVQQIITLAIVLVAAIAIARQLWRQIKGDPGSCGGCGGACGKKTTETPSSIRPAPQPTQLVTLSVRPRRINN